MRKLLVVFLMVFAATACFTSCKKGANTDHPVQEEMTEEPTTIESEEEGTMEATEETGEEAEEITPEGSEE